MVMLVENYDGDDGGRKDDDEGGRGRGEVAGRDNSLRR